MYYLSNCNMYYVVNCNNVLQLSHTLGRVDLCFRQVSAVEGMRDEGLQM